MLAVTAAYTLKWSKWNGVIANVEDHIEGLGQDCSNSIAVLR